MKYFKIQDAITLHDYIISDMGGASGYNKESIGYLSSALDQIQNDEFYPDFIDKLTHLVFACVKFHPFLDGNKRTAIYLGIFFLELNGFDGYFVHFATIMEDVVVDLASGKIDKEGLREVIYNIIY
ncbi:Fic/DOC family protein [Campylobacter pinnipediorum subsp. caledonicus]|uniref:Fic/DOC family protein n=1 Tax=Campylobacter pinnipediorum subsp. caledonicus TaxID=1874362 RepID=A0A1S6U695_9BACT|nr:type II toxin-antitoxin system death-on-curing family toxin [Campylobacter pinnipediorum]AQW85584.1 Fic/DOC family protein [Campylobacter pinnipediorum subsp. caledonicus]AQW87190.1 Fic/DOC family protein [Campylobacter pinnipediorum subsp. caledonicus]OPA71864.1 death-on-curing protein [Campylobacter pinnipediorum subsp. caledonicus]